MKILQVAMLASVISLTGCAAGLNSVQEAEYKVWEEKGLLVEEKKPQTAAILGVLPGGGSFYTRNYGYGVANLLLWPASVFWDPISGHGGAKSLNYDVTRMAISKAEKDELSKLDRDLEDQKISQDKYISEKRKIEDKYKGL